MTPHPENHDAFARRLHAELQTWRELEAPPTLVGNVLSAIRSRETAARHRPWYRRPATHWPPALRIAFGLVTLAVFLGLAWSAQELWRDVSTWPGAQAWTAFSATMAALREAARGVIDAMLLVGATFLTPVRLGILGVLAFTQILLLGLGGAVWRFAGPARTD